MEIEQHDWNNASRNNLPDLSMSPQSASNPHVAGRIRGAQGLRYDAEVNVIKKELGDLEEIRKNLGLTQRKICQLLLVDPSAWSRWCSPRGPGAPPHIYRALFWYVSWQKQKGAPVQNPTWTPPPELPQTSRPPFWVYALAGFQIILSFGVLLSLWFLRG